MNIKQDKKSKTKSNHHYKLNSYLNLVVVYLLSVVDLAMDAIA